MNLRRLKNFRYVIHIIECGELLGVFVRSAAIHGGVEWSKRQCVFVFLKHK